MCKINIRYARPSDIPALTKVHHSAWQQTYKKVVPELAEITPESYFQKYWTGLFSDQSNDRIGIIAENEFGDIMGFISYGPTSELIMNKADMDLSKAEHVGEIEKLYVNIDLPSERKEKGVAYRLFAHAMKDMNKNGNEEMLVRSFSFNKLADGFYTRQGAIVKTEDPFLMLQTRDVPGERPFMIYTPNILFHLPSIKLFLAKENVADLLAQEPMLNIPNATTHHKTVFQEASGYGL